MPKAIAILEESRRRPAGFKMAKDNRFQLMKLMYLFKDELTNPFPEETFVLTCCICLYSRVKIHYKKIIEKRCKE
jgi:hypothetical protein